MFIYMQKPGELVKKQILIQKVWEGTQGSAFLTSSLAMLVCLSTDHTWSKEELRKLRRCLRRRGGLS